MMTVAGHLAFQSCAVYVVQVDPSRPRPPMWVVPPCSGTVQANFLPRSLVERSFAVLSAAGATHIRRSDVPRKQANFQASLSIQATRRGST